MKESEAKEKWCPMVRAEVIDTMISNGVLKQITQADNRGDNHKNMFNCLGYGCAWWVWNPGPLYNLPREEWEGRCGLIHT